MLARSPVLLQLPVRRHDEDRSAARHVREALHDTYSTKTDDDVRKAVLKQAKDFEISLTEEQVKVQRTGMQGTGTLSIDVDYTVHVDMPGYPLDLHFHPSSKNRGVW